MTQQLKEEFLKSTNVKGDEKYLGRVWDSAQQMDKDLGGKGWPDGDHYRAYVQSGVNAGDISEALKFIRANANRSPSA